MRRLLLLLFRREVLERMVVAFARGLGAGFAGPLRGAVRVSEHVEVAERQVPR